MAGKGLEQRGGNPERQRQIQRRIPRILPEDLEPVVGDPIQGLRDNTLPEWGQQVIDGLIAGVTSGQISRAHFGDVDLARKRIRKVQLDNTAGIPREVKVAFSRVEGETEKPGREISLPPHLKKVKLYRRRAPEEKDPLIKVGQQLEPKSPLIVVMKGKGPGSKVIHYLSTREFPKGGLVTEIFVPDDPKGLEADGGFIYAKVDPIK